MVVRNSVKRGVSRICILAIGLVGFAGWTSAAEAHVPEITAGCSGVHLTGTNYDGEHENFWSVSIDGVAQSGTFGDSLDLTFPVPQDATAHSWSAHIEAFDGGYAGDGSGEVGPCAPPPPPPPCDQKCPVSQNGEDAADLDCRGVQRGGTFQTVRVTRGHSCVLVDAYVNGSIHAHGAHDVKVLDTTVVGGVYVSGATGTVKVGPARGCRYDPVVGTSIRVRNSHHVLICRVTVCKNISVIGNDGRITVQSSTAGIIRVNRNPKYRGGHTAHHNPGAIRLLRNRADRIITRHNDPSRRIIRRGNHTGQ